LFLFQLNRLKFLDILEH